MKSVNISKIKGYEIFDNYDIFENGDIYSHYSSKFLTNMYDSKGYHYVDLHKDGVRKCPKKHRLVALAFFRRNRKSTRFTSKSHRWR